MSLRPKVALLLGTASTWAPSATLSATRSSKATSQQIATPSSDARGVDDARAGAGHEVARPVGVVGQQPEERPPRQVLAERLDPALVGAVDDADPGLPDQHRVAGRRVRPGSAGPCPARSARRRRGRPGRSPRRRRGCAAGRCPRRSPATAPRPGAGGGPAATSAASCSVTRTWLSSTARRWALKSRPSRGTLPCTAAIVTVRPAATRRGGSSAASGPVASATSATSAGTTAARTSRRGQAPPRPRPSARPASTVTNDSSGCPADRRHGQQRPVGLAEGDAPPREAAERHARPQRLARRPRPPPPTPARPRSRDTAAMPGARGPDEHRLGRRRAPATAPGRRRCRSSAAAAAGSPGRTARRSRTRRGPGGRARSRRAARTRAARATTAVRGGEARRTAAPLRRRRPCARATKVTSGRPARGDRGRRRGVGGRGGHGRAYVPSAGHARALVTSPNVAVRPVGGATRTDERADSRVLRLVASGGWPGRRVRRRRGGRCRGGRARRGRRSGGTTRSRRRRRRSSCGTSSGPTWLACARIAARLWSSSAGCR